MSDIECFHQRRLWVVFNLSDRSGLWAEVTDSEGETGWVEIGYLDCQS